MHLLDLLPIWAVFLLTVMLGLLAVESGYRLGILWKKRHPDEKDTHIGSMLAATLGLWAFLLAFLVGIATDRFEARRSLLVAETNAIGTTYLRAGYLPEPYNSQSRELLREYASERLKLVELDSYTAARERSENIHPQLWAVVQDLVAAQPPNPIMALYISALNETIDLHTTRIAALTIARIPITIYIGIYLVALLGLTMLGFQSGINGKRDLIVTLVMILVFSVVMLLIIDLDRSWGGFLRVNQQPMIDLINSFKNFQ
jgi:hypothetical protein